MVTHFRLLTLGAPLLLTAAGDVVRFRTKKHFALLIRIALEPGRRLAREYLIDLLWREAAGGRGRHSLSQAVTVLRSTIGKHLLAAHRATVALEPGAIAVDVHELDEGRAEIRGEFLEGFEIRGARGFTEWRDAWVASLHPRLRDCLVRRMNQSKRQGDFAALERHARLLQQLDPLSEDAVRGIMEARAWAGDRPNALKVYAHHARRLGAELGAKPKLELARVAELLREGRTVGSRLRDEVGPASTEERRFEAESILGRQREFGELYDTWKEVGQRQPRLILILGDHGIGKTTLTNAFASSCQMEGAVIARAQAFEAEKNLPYAVLAELVRQLALQRAIGAAEPSALAELTRLVPEIFSVFPGVPRPTDSDPEVVSLRLAEAFLKAVSAAAEETPAVLLVDDVHLADTASMAILHILARKLEGLRMLLLFTARGWTSSGAAVALGVEGDSAATRLRTLELEPLSEAAATQLVQRECPRGRSRWGSPPITRLVRSGCGNPLALELLTRDWIAHGPDSLVTRIGDPGAPLITRVTVPQTIRIMVDREVRRLDSGARAVLELAAVLGRRIGDLWLYRVIGCSEGEALARLATLLDAHLLRDVAGQLEFRNELVRVHAYYNVPSTVRFALHRKLAKALEGHRGSDGDRPDIEIAWHYIAGNNLPRAIPFALSGAESSLGTGAPQEAERVLAALRATPQDRPTGRRLQLLLSSAQLSQSKAEAALRDLDEVINEDGAPKEDIAKATRLYASAMYLINQNSTAKHSEMATRAAVVARECGDKELLARALFECARAGVESGNEDMIRNARGEIRHSLIQDGRDIPAIAHHADAYCSYFLLDIGDACRAANQAVASLCNGSNIGDLSLALTGLGNCEMALCHLEEARKAYRTALDYSRRIGDQCRNSIVASNLAATYLMSGEIQRAIEFGEESLAQGAQAPSQPGLLRTWTNLAFAYVLAGSVDKARDCFVAWQEWMRNGRSWSARMEYLCDSASIELAFGNIGAALELVGEAERQYEGRGHIFVNQGALERLKIFLAYHTRGLEYASMLANEALETFRGRHALAYLDAVAAQSWVEGMSSGRQATKTIGELRLFEAWGVSGKRAVLAAQGFLPPPRES